MAHINTSVDYGIHCLLWLVDPACGHPSSRDLAKLQGILPYFLAKIFPKQEKAGIVQASEGVRGEYRLAKPPADITVLAIVDAIECHKALFDCQEIRDRCAVFDNDAPVWATTGVCGIHAVMLRAEKATIDSANIYGHCRYSLMLQLLHAADANYWCETHGDPRPSDALQILRNSQMRACENESDQANARKAAAKAEKKIATWSDPFVHCTQD